MCDLWKNTTDKTVPIGAFPKQIEWALKELPKVKHLKLYNSGSFFDKKAIPEADYERIAQLLSSFETVVVESHPKFINERCLYFAKLLKPELQVAIGLETAHQLVLERLNKQMTLDDFKNSVQFLQQHQIKSRAFILLRPPWLTESEGLLWAKKSIDFAFESGVECCTVIPVRAGNGMLDKMLKEGEFEKPSIASLESAVEYGISLKSGRVFADLWDLQLFSTCEKCSKLREKRLDAMNLTQVVSPKISCTC